MILNRVLLKPILQFQKCCELQFGRNPIVLVIIIPVRNSPWYNHYTLASVKRGFIRETKIIKQGDPVVPSQYRIMDFGHIGREPLIANFFIGTIVI
jgi:hypothetical protein